MKLKLPESSGSSQLFTYCAFLSYSHADGNLASRLSATLERYRLPAGVIPSAALCLRSDPRRIGRIFRDEEELAAGGKLSHALVEALANSAHLIVLCSPAAARSTWIDRELREFRRLRPDGKILPVLATDHGVAAAEFAAWLPPALLQFEPGFAEGDGPLIPDLRKLGLKTTSLQLIAALLPGLKYDDLVNRDAVRSRQRWRLGAIATALLLTILGTLAWMAVRAADTAEREHLSAQSRDSEAKAAASQQALRDGAASLAARMALHGLPSDGDARPWVWQAEVALNNAYQRLTERLHLITGTSDVLLAAPRAGNKNELLTVNAAGDFVRWDMVSQQKLSSTLKAANQLLEARYIPGRNGVLASDKAGNLVWWDVGANTLVVRKMADEIRSISPDSSGTQAIILSANAKAPMPTATVVVLPSMETIRVLPIPAGIVPQFMHLSARQGLLTLVGNDAAVNRYFSWISDLQGKVRHRLPDSVEIQVNSFLSTEGDKLFVFDADGQVTVTDVATGKNSFTAKLNEIPFAAHYQPERKLLVVGTNNGKLYLCDLKTNQVRLVANDHTAGFVSLSMDTGAAMVYGGSAQGGVGGWLLDAPHAPVLLQSNPYHSMYLDRDADGVLKLRNGGTPVPAVKVVNEEKAGHKPAQVHSSVMRLSVNGQFLAIGSPNGYVSVLDASTPVPKIIASVWLAGSDVAQVRFDRTSKRLLVGMYNGELFSWDFGALSVPVKLFHGPGRVIGIVAGAGDSLLAGFPDGTIVVTRGQLPAQRFIQTGSEISAMDGNAKTLLVTDMHGDGRVYSASDGKFIRALDEPGRTHPANANSSRVLLREDGKLGLITGSDNRLRLWDITSGRLIAGFPMQKGSVHGALAFGPDGAFAYADQGIAHIVDRQLRSTTLLDTYPIEQLRFSSHVGTMTMFTMSGNGMLRQWTRATGMPHAFTDLRLGNDANPRGTELIQHPDGKRLFTVTGGISFVVAVLPHGPALPAAVRQELPAASRNLSTKDLERYHVRPNISVAVVPETGLISLIGNWLLGRPTIEGKK